MLLPLLFVIVAALFATLAQRMGREMAVAAAAAGYTVNIAGSLAGVIAFAVISWLAAAARRVVCGRLRARRCRSLLTAEPGRPAPRMPAVAANVAAAGRVARPRARDGARRALVALLQDHGRPGRP